MDAPSSMRSWPAHAWRSRARASISRWSACCSTPAPGPTGASTTEKAASVFARSEGLGVASFRAFLPGASSDAGDPQRRCGRAARSTRRRWPTLFQVSGDATRWSAWRAATLMPPRRRAPTAPSRPSARSAICSTAHPPSARARAHHHPQPRRAAGRTILARCSASAPSGRAGRCFTACRSAMSGRTGRRRRRASAGWVPFHKLSQWLALLAARTPRGGPA